MRLEKSGIRTPLFYGLLRWLTTTAITLTVALDWLFPKTMGAEMEQGHCE
jgi:hypothetical protein